LPKSNPYVGSFHRGSGTQRHGGGWKDEGIDVERSLGSGYPQSSKEVSKSASLTSLSTAPLSPLLAPQNKQERTLSVLSAGARVLLARERERARVRESSISVAERGKKQDTPYCQALHGRMEASMAM
jgi:hypothetical protein